jgi:hypothetical protein
MTLRLQPVQVGTGSFDVDGQLVFDDDLLAAVLVRLSEVHEDLAGMWFLEAGFGLVGTAHRPTFAKLDAAQTWIGQRLAHEA